MYQGILFYPWTGRLPCVLLVLLRALRRAGLVMYPKVCRLGCSVTSLKLMYFHSFVQYFLISRALINAVGCVR